MFNMLETLTQSEPQTKIKKSEQTQRRILETALELFRKRGFEAATMRQIAAEAGMSLGAAYYYFESKEAIVAAYYDYVQSEHAARAAAMFAKSSDLRDRITAALHTKLDILKDDRRLLSALFRYGGDPDHPLSWFGRGTREQRRESMAVFAEAMRDLRLPRDLREAAPLLLWTLHMGIILYFIYDDSPQQRRTRRLVDRAVEFVIVVAGIAAFPLLKPVRSRVMVVLREAELLPDAPVLPTAS